MINLCKKCGGKNLYCRHIEKFECFGEATEENFYKAYDECVRLFRGEE